MSKVLIFSDIHIHAHRNSQHRLDDCLKALRWAFQTARDRSIKDVLFLGDLFQNRLKIDTLAYCLTYDIFNSFKDLSITILQGNHDLWFHERQDVSSVKPFSALDSVQVIDHPSTVKIGDMNVDFIPYMKDPADAFHAFRDPSPVLCGHLSVNKAILNRAGTQADVSVEIENDMVAVEAEWFSPWKKVFLGHYHGAQIIENIEYVGSPLQLSYGEAHQEKHLIIFDTKTFEEEYVINDFSPKFMIVPIDHINECALDNAFVRVQVPNVASADLVETRQKLTKQFKMQSLEFCEVHGYEQAINRDVLQEKFKMSNGDVLERYVDTVGTGQLDRNKLIVIGKNICGVEG